MGIIIVPQAERPLRAVQRCRADEIRPERAAFLIGGNDFVDVDCDKLPVPVTEAEPYWCYFPFVSVHEIICTGVSMHRIVSISASSTN